MGEEKGERGNQPTGLTRSQQHTPSHTECKQMENVDSTRRWRTQVPVGGGWKWVIVGGAGR